ncbi:MAG: hypothetical protein IT578_10880 [Verrucomicrobiae bacterium]|nr:hypothetical protein [Verrucomicrobiae bacterium]
MPKSSTPRERVEAVLRGKRPSKTPFTMYENKIPQCAAEREMRARGLCIVKRDVPAFCTVYPNVRTTQAVEWRDEKKFVRTRYETPAGVLESLYEEAGFTQWWHEKLFKSADDYKALLFFLQDARHTPNYAAFARAQDDFGGDAIFRAGFGLEPLQDLISGNLMDMQDFCVEWMDHRDDVLRLYAAIVEQRRAIYSLVADSPAWIANYGGNVTVDIIGVRNFEEYYLPHYQEAAEAMHRRGKLVGCHLDANCRLLAPLIARSSLDYIEAFTPAPDTDMTLAEARAAWPDKVLWINFPSSVHLRPDSEVEQTAFRLADEAGRSEGFLMGITEDIPANRWQASCRAIMDGLDRHARERPARYAT